MPPRPLRARYGLPAALVCALALGGCGAASREGAYLRHGRQFLAAGDLAKARIEFRNALQIAPRDDQARYQNGIIDEKLGNPREAAQFFQGAIDVNPNDLPARAHLGRLMLFAGAPQRALDTVKPALATHPDDVGLLTVRAAARARLNDLHGAREDAKRAVALAPANENAVATLAGIYQAGGDIAKAQSLLEHTIQILPATVGLRLALAQVYINTGHVERIEPLLKAVVRLQPAKAAYRVSLAQFYARVNRLDAAERVLRDAVKDLPQERQMKVELVSFLATRRSLDLAEKQLDEYIAAAPKDYTLQFLLATLYLRGNAIGEAEAVYKGVIAAEDLRPAGLTARIRLAAVLVQQNDRADAKKLIAQVLAKDPREDDALVLSGNLALDDGDPATAIADLRAALRDQPNGVAIMRELARAHLANGEPALAEDTMRSAVQANPADAGARLDLAILLTQLGKPQQAKPIIDALVKQQPGNVQALDVQFQIAMANKDMGAAAAAAEAMVAQQPKEPLGYHYQGLVAEHEKRDADALTIYAKGLQAAPDAPVLLQDTTRVLVATHQRPQALAQLDGAIGKYPQSALAADLKGEVLLTANRPREAIAPLKTAIARQPKWWRPYHDLAIAKSALHDQAATIAALREGIASAADPIRLDTELAELFVKRGRPNDAEQVYEAELLRNPSAVVAANNLAMLLVQYRHDQQSLDRAKTLTAAFAHSPNASLLDTYGWVRYQRGETAAAIHALRTASAKMPNSAEFLYHLGMAEARLGNAAAACSDLQKALALSKSFTGADEAQATLHKLLKPGPTTQRLRRWLPDKPSPWHLRSPATGTAALPRIRHCRPCVGAMRDPRSSADMRRRATPDRCS